MPLSTPLLSPLLPLVLAGCRNCLLAATKVGTASADGGAGATAALAFDRLRAITASTSRASSTHRARTATRAVDVGTPALTPTEVDPGGGSSLF